MYLIYVSFVHILQYNTAHNWCCLWVVKKGLLAHLLLGNRRQDILHCRKSSMKQFRIFNIQYRPLERITWGVFGRCLKNVKDLSLANLFTSCYSSWSLSFYPLQTFGLSCEQALLATRKSNIAVFTGTFGALACVNVAFLSFIVYIVFN